MLYAPFCKCSSASEVCSPANFQKYGYKGLCLSCGNYVYHTFKYLEYPRGVRVAYVKQILYNTHQVTKIEMPDGSWRIIDSFDMFGLHNIEELFYFDWIEFDDETVYGAWLPDPE